MLLESGHAGLVCRLGLHFVGVCTCKNSNNEINDWPKMVVLS